MKKFAGIISLFWMVASLAQSPGSIAGGGYVPARIAHVSANLSGSGPTIPSNFIGISVEVADLIGGYYQGATGNAASMISLLQLLGANGVFNFGGSSSSTSTTPALTQNISNSAQSFLVGIGAGWTTSVMYTLDLFANNSALAATQAGFLATSFGASHMVFQFDNEPFASGHFGSVGAYQTAWNAYYTAVTGAVASAGYAPWADSDNQDAVSVISGLTPGFGGIAAITYHRYSQGTTAAQVIGYVPAHYYFLNFNASVFTAAQNAMQRLSETNSLGNRGLAGVSDTLSGATFILNEAAQVAAIGYAGINVHNVYAGGAGVYNPLVQLGDSNFTAGAVFYGMMLFSKIEGQQIIPSAVGGNANIVSLATIRVSGKANILVVNNDTFNPSIVRPDQSSAWSTASVLQIKSATGAACGDTSLTIGGSAIGKSGAWSGVPFSINSGDSIRLGPCEAALVQVQ
jgi:hypothetical protein